MQSPKVPTTTVSDDADGPRRSVAATALRIGLMLALLTGAYAFLHYTPWGQNIGTKDFQSFDAWLSGFGQWGWLAFVAAGGALVAMGFPRLAMSFIAGAIYGAGMGTVLAQLATTLAAVPAFFYTRFVGRSLIMRRAGRRRQALDAVVRRHGFMVVLLIRLCPVGNTFLTNMLLGVTSVPFWTYLAASFIGFLPLTFTLALMGKGLAYGGLRLWVGCGLFLGFSVFFVWYSRRSALARDVVAIFRTPRE